MRIQKKHKIYAAIVGAALAAWGVDSYFFESAPVPPADTAAAAPAPAHDAPAGPSPEQPSAPNWLAHQLLTWSHNNPVSAESSRDAFSIPASWVSVHPTAAPTTQPAVSRTAQDFQREHHLTAVIVGRGTGSVLIDGSLLHVGQTIGGCRLISVSKGCADFAAQDGARFRLLISHE